MRHLWRHILAIIAVVTGGALALMNVLGCLQSFSDPRIAYGAAGVGLLADLGIVALMFGFHDFGQKRRWLALTLAIPFWVAFSAYTVCSGATWLQHTFEMDQKPVQQQQFSEQQKQEKLKAEQTGLDKANGVALTTKSKEIRENALKMAADARARIAALEAMNTFEAAAVPEPVKSPLAGYERLAAFILWSASQACWFMAYGEAAAEAQNAAQKRCGTRPGRRGAASPAPMGQSLKSRENLLRPTMGQEAGQGGVIIPMRRPAKPSPNEVIALRQRGMSQAAIGEAFGVSARTIRRILEGASDGAHAAQMA